MKDKIIVSFFLVIISSSVDAKQHECKSKNDNHLQMKAFNNTDCYFVVKGASEKTNRKLDNGTFVFNISAAREICKKAKATLPIIKSKEENQFLVDNYEIIEDQWNVTFIALGLHQV